MNVRTHMDTKKIPIIIPGLIFLQKAFLLSFGGRGWGGGGCYREEFCALKLVWFV